jgi:putative redox protein
MAKSEKVEFEGAQGDMLAARLEMPAGKPRAYALFAHCFTCSKDIFAASRIAGALAEQGFAVLRFDFTGLGASDGEFANTNFSSNVGDLLKAVEYLRTEHAAPSIIIGHSLGGAAVLAAAGQVPEIKAVATIGAPSDPGHVQHLFAAARPEIEAKGEAEVSLAGRTFRIQKQFLDDIESHRLADAIGAMRKALLVFHSPVDQTVGVENAAEIFMAAKHPKSFISLDDADHLLSRHEDAIYVATVLSGWASRYLPEDEAQAADDAPGEPGTVIVRETGNGKFQQDVINGPHRMLADEPPSVGGTDTGPTPYGYLLAGLGACSSMTVRMYADRKKWPLEHVSVSLRHDKIHATDCEECETRDGKVDKIEREIALTGPLDDEQRARLLEIADKCPVHRTLHSEVQILSRLKD